MSNYQGYTRFYFFTFLVIFQKVLVVPAALRIRIGRNYLEIGDVLKTNETAMILHGFDVLNYVVRVFVISTALLSSTTLLCVDDRCLRQCGLFIRSLCGCSRVGTSVRFVDRSFVCWFVRSSFVRRSFIRSVCAMFAR